MHSHSRVYEGRHKRLFRTHNSRPGNISANEASFLVAKGCVDRSSWHAFVQRQNLLTDPRSSKDRLLSTIWLSQKSILFCIKCNLLISNAGPLKNNKLRNRTITTNHVVVTTSGAALYTVADCIQPQNKLKILELSEIFGVSFRTVSFNDLHYPSWRDWRDGDPQSKGSTNSIYPGKARRSGRKTRHCEMTLCAEEDKTQRFRSFVCTFLFSTLHPGSIHVDRRCGQSCSRAFGCNHGN